MARNYFKNIIRFLKKSSPWQKLTMVLVLLLICIVILNMGQKTTVQEGFTDEKTFETRRGKNIFDPFYTSIYDDLVYSPIKNDFEISQIREITKPTSSSSILDVGCGTGHHVNAFVKNGWPSSGVDISEAMIKQAQQNYPDLDFQVGNVLSSIAYSQGSLTHITCLYFTIYYIKNKALFFQNCYNWLAPGGYLILHLVDRKNFDPILPAGDPLSIISAQKYAKNRITNSVVQFDNFEYRSNFKVFPNDWKDPVPSAIFEEKFLWTTPKGKVRKNEHKLYMPTQSEIIGQAKDVGFNLLAKIDMKTCQYDNQYMYVLYRPN